MVSPETTVATLLDSMVRHHPYRVGVAQEQSIEAVVSQSDVVRWL